MLISDNVDVLYFEYGDGNEHRSVLKTMFFYKNCPNASYYLIVCNMIILTVCKPWVLFNMILPGVYPAKCCCHWGVTVIFIFLPTCVKYFKLSY